MSRALGACHALDVPFVFGSIRHPLARPLTGFTASAPRLSRNMQQCWIGFARQGDPDHAWLPSWATYSSGNRTTMIFDRRCSLQDAPLDAERRLLEKWSAADSDDKRRVQRNP
jgi:para-nitrobenzyl esterase